MSDTDRSSSPPLHHHPLDEGRLEHRYAQLDQVRLHYVQCGPEDGPLVILLHGFPDFWYVWRNQIVPLADAGLRVVAPDMRGYGRSDKPQGVGNYRVERLADDIAQLVRQLGPGKASVVGHDWGGVVAWYFAMRHPELLDRLSIMNAPHPAHYLSMMTTPDQIVRSSYILYFQLPVLPERKLSRHDFRAMRKILRNASKRPDAFTDADIERYIESQRDGALTTMLNYYRALLRRNPLDTVKTLRKIERPTLVLWGKDDPFLHDRYAEPPAQWVWDLRCERIADAGHWVQIDAREHINAQLVSFLLP